MRKIFTFLLIYVLNSFLHAQVDHDILILKTTVYTREDAPNPGANVTVLKNKKTFLKTTSDTAGNVILKLPLNSDYTIIISKPGMLTKKFLVSTRGPQMETEAKVSYQFELEGIKIYPPFKGVDYSVFKKPLFTVKYNSVNNKFDVDKQTVDALIQQVENVNRAEKKAEEKKNKK